MIWRCERQAPARHGGRGQEAGFTLIEVIVVLAVLAFAMALIVGYKPPWSSGLGLRGTAAELASSLRLARSEAILQNRPVLFELDLSGRRFRIGNGTVPHFPRQPPIELLTVGGARRGFASGGVRFHAAGSS